MITRIKVDGFKTLSDFQLTLNPGLNILVGPNGSGKTNIVSFFEFLAQLVATDPAEATSLLGGAGAVFRRVNDTYQANILATVFGSFALDQERVFPMPIPRASEKNKYAFYEYGFTLLFSSGLESVVFTRQHFRYKYTGSFVSAEKIETESKEWSLEVESILDSKEMTTKAKVRRLEKSASDLLPFFPSKSKQADEEIRQTENFLSQLLSTNASIPSVLCRFNPRLLFLSQDISGGQTYNIIPSRVKMPEDSAKPPGIATDGSGLSSTLYSLKRRNRAPDFKPWTFLSPGRMNAMKTTTLETLKGYFQLANNSIQDVDVANDSFSNQLRVSFAIRSGDYSAIVPLSLMSDGTLKWLTLLTAALTASSVFSIEEPENYLHPQMQGQFVNIIREILFKEKTHVCTIMTTHSETLLNHCKPAELIVVALREGKTMAYRCKNESDLSDEIAKTGFGLGYYYIAGAIDDEQ